MSTKQKIKTGIALFMTCLLLGMMTFDLSGQMIHEWMGVAISLLICIHFFLNISWCKGLMRGHYTSARILQTVINLILLISFIALVICGMLLSDYAFSFLPVADAGELAYIVHHTAGYWLFAGASMHLGLHWNRVIRMTRHIFGIQSENRSRTIVLRIIAIACFALGIYCFAELQFGGYMLNLVRYSYLAYGQPAGLIIGKYAAVMGLFAIAAYYLQLLLHNKTRFVGRRQNSKNKE
ncbi:MAG: DUF4405 domain-containing protein [Lachnospiraceae bacterium]|nr:DUF4405 domain-containing protein [Lachnospiraceae bacterium]